MFLTIVFTDISSLRDLVLVFANVTNVEIVELHF